MGLQWRTSSPRILFIMSDSPLVIIAVFLGALYLAKLWRDDYRRDQTGDPNPQALPGATSAPMVAIVIAIIGALILVGVETAGEIAMGVSAQQSDITAIFLLAMIGAGLIEEVIFRGYLVISNKGKAALYGSIFGFSLLFALLHVQYYTEIPEDGSWRDFIFVIDQKSAWTLLILFLNSIWFYTVRFFPLNPRHSLLPCFLAHIASNIGVFIVKLAQGHVTAWF